MDKSIEPPRSLIDKNKPNLLIVNPNDIDQVWEDVKPLLDKALVHSDGEMLSSDILDLILDGREVLWVGIDNGEIFCAGVTEVITYPRKKVLRIITFASKSGHDYELWKDFTDIIEGFGVRHECSSIEAWTRKGLAKKLKWDNEYSVITKDIKNKWQ